MKIKPEAINLDVEKILEIIEKSKPIKKELDRKKSINSFYKTYMSINDIIDRAISLYRTAHKHFLNEEEKTILALYLIIDNDKKFLEKYMQLKGNFNLIGKYYGVSQQFIILRFKIYRKIKKYENNLENNKMKLTLKNKK